MKTKQRANTLCPYPERYTARDIFATEDQVIELVAGFIRGLQPSYVIESGTYLGHMAKAMGEALLKNGQGTLDTLEVDADHVKQASLLCRGLPVNVIHGDSREFTPKQTVDFAWLDSKQPFRVPEFHQYWPWFAPHTIVGFHDTGTRFKLKPLIEDLEEKGFVKAIYLPTFRGVAFCQVMK